jgi:hypothetical protein
MKREVKARRRPPPGIEPAPERPAAQAEPTLSRQEHLQGLWVTLGLADEEEEASVAAATAAE